MPLPIGRLPAVLAAATIAAPACAQWNAVAYVDSQGRSWRQLSFSCGASWNQVASMCPSDGATPCAGVLNGHPIDGWVWATRAQVEALLVELGAAVDPADCDTGPTADGGVFQWFHNTLSPENGYFIEGWTANAAAIPGLPGHAFAPSVRLDLDVMLAMTCVATSFPRSQADAGRGVWLFRHPCAADFDLDGTVGGTDLGALLAEWGTSDPQPRTDLTGDGVVNGEDLGALLASWGGESCP
jgi:hypothetical protein